MNCRYFTALDYPMISTWWAARQWPSLPIEMLPKNGFVVDNYCAGFLYSTDSQICWMEFLVSNPATDSKARNEAMNLLIATLLGRAKDLGFSIIFTSVIDEKLKNRYQTHDFIVTETGMTNLIRRL